MKTLVRSLALCVPLFFISSTGFSAQNSEFYNPGSRTDAAYSKVGSHLPQAGKNYAYYRWHRWHRWHHWHRGYWHHWHRGHRWHHWRY